jgi:hypothetical protein
MEENIFETNNLFSVILAYTDGAGCVMKSRDGERFIVKRKDGLDVDNCDVAKILKKNWGFVDIVENFAVSKVEAVS